MGRGGEGPGEVDAHITCQQECEKHECDRESMKYATPATRLLFHIFSAKSTKNSMNSVMESPQE